MHRHFVCSPVRMHVLRNVIENCLLPIYRMADNLPTETDTNFLQIDAAHFRNVGRYVNFILNTLVEFMLT